MTDQQKMNGEGTREASSEVAPSDPHDELLLLPWQSPKSDGGDESPVYSQYSSCGDSEFERYCSANSVMGTPSLCSSIGTFQDCGDSEFGSVRSFGLGEVSSLENFQLGGGFCRNSGDGKPSSSSRSGCLSDHIIESCEGKSSLELRNDVVEKKLVVMNDGLNSCRSMENSLWHVSNGSNTGNVVSSMVESDSELPVVMDLHTVLDEELYVGDDGHGVVRWRDPSESAFMQSSGGTLSAQRTNNIEGIEENILSSGVNSYTHYSAMAEGEDHAHINVEPVNSCLDDLFSHSDVEFGKREDGGCSDEDKASSTFEHSEGEDSMFGDGTDGEQKMDYLHQRNMQYHQEANVNKEKSLLMSSSSAFGADDWDDFEQETRESNINSIILEKKEPSIETERKPLSSLFQTNTGFPGVGSEQGEMSMDISVDSNQVQGADELAGCTGNASLTPVDFSNFCEMEQGKDVVDVFVTKNQAGDLDELADYLKTRSGSDILPRDQDQLSQEAPLEKCLSFTDGNLRNCGPLLSTQEFDNVDGRQVSEHQEPDVSTLQLDPLSDVTDGQLCSASNKTPEDQGVGHLGELCSSQPMNQNSIKKSQKDSPASFNLFEDRTKEVKTENLELNEFYNEVVHEMEEILLDSTESPGARFTQGERANQSHLHLPLRDGGSTASTSGNDDVYPFIQHPLTIDGVEVVGAKQKKGGVSFGERLVGVKEYTVYVIRVCSGKNHWEVERRYRDFCTLYRQLKTLFTGQGQSLPSPWSSVERESRKIFGNVSPDVVAERSALIQECLRSILHFGFPSGLPSTLMLFLSPSKDNPSSPASNAGDSDSPFSARGMGSILTFGKTISLIVEIQPYKSVKQILEAQHHICAGCHRNFDDGKTRMLEFVQTLGWGKPRLCEYTGQLFCSSCHTNETAVLPARVLHHWDFTQYPVSQLAKSYLESIHDKPMLCVSAVNPFLFSKVPALQQVMSVRRRIGTMLPYVHCPFRMSIYKALASRRYLLESNDFFALRDLIDLSKGAFAALPVMVETVSRKILEHITEQCLVCCDVGVPCNARQACHDPSSLIFPFQEGEIERCKSCKSVFHKPCFRKIPSCPCGEVLKQDKDKGGSTDASHRFGRELSRSTVDLFGRKSDSNSTTGFLSGLFTKARPEKLLGPKDRDNIILMGSLPSTSL